MLSSEVLPFGDFKQIQTRPVVDLQVRDEDDVTFEFGKVDVLGSGQYCFKVQKVTRYSNEG